MIHETELQVRLRRAKESFEYAKERENQARRELASAEETRRIAKERYEELFLAEEQEECKRLRHAAESAT